MIVLVVRQSIRHTCPNGPAMPLPPLDRFRDSWIDHARPPMLLGIAPKKNNKQHNSRCSKVARPCSGGYTCQKRRSRTAAAPLHIDTSEAVQTRSPRLFAMRPLNAAAGPNRREFLFCHSLACLCKIRFATRQCRRSRPLLNMNRKRRSIRGGVKISSVRNVFFLARQKRGTEFSYNHGPCRSRFCAPPRA